VAEKKQELAQKLALDTYGARLLMVDAAKGKIKPKFHLKQQTLL
jgi:hypothetical protein